VCDEHDSNAVSFVTILKIDFVVTTLAIIEIDWTILHNQMFDFHAGIDIKDNRW